MRLSQLVALLLFTNCFAHSGKAYAGYRETNEHPLERHRFVATFAVGEEQVSTKQTDSYDPRQDCLYRLYLASTVLGVLGGIAGVCLIFWQVRLLRQTVNASSEQSKAMERHIGEAARSADAMEGIATTIQTGNRAILRAYLTVTIGAISLYQERREPGQPDLKFETRPNLTNTGNTPARNVSIRIAADILPIPIPDTFQFPLEEDEEIKNAGIVGAHQTSVLAGTVKDFVPDAEVGAIKEARTKALCTWGVVTYEDIFGATHTTKFGQWITWNPNGAVVGYYVAGQNDSD
jgi:hypothetical protein